MQTLSLNLDRLGAALKALRQTHDPDPENKIGLGVNCLAVLIHQLAQDGLAQEDLQPLIDLEACLQNRRTTERRETVPNRRRGGAPSEAVLARIAAVIDVLVKAGHEEAEAAQMLMRRMLGAGISAPLQGGDARGWKRLLAWRADVKGGVGSAEARDEYQAFTRQLEGIPPAERLKRVVEEQFWDRRRNPR
jgi:hypothetical protein